MLFLEIFVAVKSDSPLYDCRKLNTPNLSKPKPEIWPMRRSAAAPA